MENNDNDAVKLLGEMLVGMHVAIAHVFTVLHHEDVLDRQRAASGLLKSIDRLPEGQRQGIAGATLRSIAGLVQDQKTPEEKRLTFELLKSIQRGSDPTTEE